METKNSIFREVFVLTSFFLDTNAFILLSGLSADDLSLLGKRIAESESYLCIGHVQLDEQNNQEYRVYQQKIDKALKKFTEKGIVINIEPTNEIVLGVSRFGLAKFGSQEIGKLDEVLRTRIEKCMGKRVKGHLNIARDALIAVSSLSHDYFITSDRCLFLSWINAVQSNEETKRALEQKYKIPKIVLKRKPRGIFEAIMANA